MKTFKSVMAICLSLVVVPQHTNAQDLPGKVKIDTVLKVPGEFQFTEGPTYDGSRFVYFTDIPANRIHRLDMIAFLSDTKVAPEVFLENTNSANGLLIDGNGKLIMCQMGGLISVVDVSSKTRTPLATEFKGVRFNACNDLTIDREGGLYFTDPRYAAPEPWPQTIEAVYYRAADGKIERIAEDMIAPNGIVLSPDAKTLYVLPSMQRDMIAFDVTGPGQLSNRRVFCQVDPKEGNADSQSGGDGGTIDTQGRLYVTTHQGIDVYSAAGEHLQTIEVPEQPANVCFAGPERQYLVATARTSVYVIKTDATGVAPLGALK